MSPSEKSLTQSLPNRAYHPRLITVEVSETHAKEWFRSLLSGVEFLHKRGVVHNDIKYVVPVHTALAEIA